MAARGWLDLPRFAGRISGVDGENGLSWGGFGLLWRFRISWRGFRALGLGFMVIEGLGFKNWSGSG